MIRLLTIALVSFFSIIMYISIFHRIPIIKGDPAWYISFVCAWIMTPLILFKIWKEKPNPDVIPIDPKDPIILAQITKSKSEIYKFQKALEEGILEAYIKFPYCFDGETEHIWGLAHQEKEGKVIVSLESSPVGSIPDQLHQRFPVDVNDIEDWMLVDGQGKTYGGYSILALAKIYTRDYGKLPKCHAHYLKNFVDFKWPENT